MGTYEAGGKADEWVKLVKDVCEDRYSKEDWKKRYLGGFESELRFRKVN